MQKNQKTKCSMQGGLTAPALTILLPMRKRCTGQAMILVGGKNMWDAKTSPEAAAPACSAAVHIEPDGNRDKETLRDRFVRKNQMKTRCKT